MRSSPSGTADRTCSSSDDVEMPSVGDDQVLVRVHASSVNPTEWYQVTGPVFARGGGLRRPKDTSMGADVAGRVEAIGKDVTTLRPGDEVFGTAPGAWAEYVAARETSVAPKPPSLPFEEAAAVPIAGSQRSRPCVTTGTCSRARRS